MDSDHCFRARALGQAWRICGFVTVTINSPSILGYLKKLLIEPLQGSCRFHEGFLNVRDDTPANHNLQDTRDLN